MIFFILLLSFQGYLCQDPPAEQQLRLSRFPLLHFEHLRYVVVTRPSCKFTGPISNPGQSVLSSTSCWSFLYGLGDGMVIRENLGEANCGHTCLMFLGNGLLPTTNSRSKMTKMSTDAKLKVQSDWNDHGGHAQLWNIPLPNFDSHVACWRGNHRGHSQF